MIENQPAVSDVERCNISKLNLAELFARIEAEEAAVSRRKVILGLASIAAPFVIRTPGLLMPVRNRQCEHLGDFFDGDFTVSLGGERPSMYDKYGFFNWRDFPPSLQEVKEWRASMNSLIDQRIFVSWTGEGFARIAAMGAAEDRFMAMGLL